MTTIEKLERLVKEKNGNTYFDADGYAVIVTDRRRDFYAAPTLTEAIDKAYEAAFPTRKLEPGDIFFYLGAIYRMTEKGFEYPDGSVADPEWISSSIEPEKYGRGFTIIGKAYDEPIEVKP